MSHVLKVDFLVGAILLEIVRQRPGVEVNAGEVDHIVEAAERICAFSESIQKNSDFIKSK